VLQLLLAAQMTSHFLEHFPLVASFFLLFAGVFNIATVRLFSSALTYLTGVLLAEKR
jgi:hypothetical protein